MGRAALALADAPGHELRPARGARRHPVAVLPRGPPRAARTSTAGSGPTTRPSGAASRRLGRRPRAAGRRADRRLPDPPHHRPPARQLQHRRADRRLRVAAARRRDHRPVARGRRRARRSPTGEPVRVISRRGERRGAGARRRRAAAGTGLHDDPLPRRGRHERAHDQGRPTRRAARPSSRPPRSDWRRCPGRVPALWTFASWPPRPPRPSGTPSDAVRSEPRRDGRAATARPPTPGPPAPAPRPAVAGTCCCPPSTPCNDRVGWISRGGLDYVCRRLLGRAGRGVRRRLLLRPVRAGAPPAARACTCATTSPAPWPDPGSHALPARSTCCRARASALCERAPAALAAWRPVATPSAAPRPDGRAEDRGAVRCPRPASRRSCSCAGSASSTRQPRRLPRARRLRRAAQGDRDRARPACSTSCTSGLVGRGGAAFPTGRKWEAVAAPARPPPLPRLPTPTRASRARSRTAC